jgi:HD-GYP domain-containing protein (c-di-GMP phosphodiesterase class II)
VLDAYEAMTSGRPYREPFTPVEALDELRRCAGKQFDARVVEEFGRLLDEGGHAPASGSSEPSARGSSARDHARDRDAVR